MSCSPVLVRSVSPLGEVRYSLGDPLVDSYLEFVAGRCRPNTLRAVTLDLKVFFSVVTKDPVEVGSPDVFEFLAHQRGDRTVVRMSDRESGLARNADAITEALAVAPGNTVLCLETTAGSGTALGATFEELAEIIVREMGKPVDF